MVILGLGSNLGDRAAMLDTAVQLLDGVLTGIRRSSVVETKALLPEGAPLDWDIPFLNMAVAGESNYTPEALLVKIKEIEKELGRQDRGRWGPREIDIDILAMDDLVMETNGLSIPHKELLSRPFALGPLAELAPDWKWPVDDANFGKTAKALSGL